ncbi:unnamed protein product, partial [Eretmochelys imbricata]
CWLAGHSGAWGEPSYPKPSISLSPSGGVSLGGAVAVWCQGQHRGVRFVLNKEGRRFQTVASKGLEAVFPISNVRREDRGSYSCSYQNRLEPFAVSSPSDPGELVVRGPPAPSGHPADGAASGSRAGADPAPAMVLVEEPPQIPQRDAPRLAQQQPQHSPIEGQLRAGIQPPPGKSWKEKQLLGGSKGTRWEDFTLHWSPGGLSHSRGVGLGRAGIPGEMGPCCEWERNSLPTVGLQVRTKRKRGLVAP